MLLFKCDAAQKFERLINHPVHRNFKIAENLTQYNCQREEFSNEPSNLQEPAL